MWAHLIELVLLLYRLVSGGKLNFLKLLNGPMLVLIYLHQLNKVLEEFLRDLAAYLRDGIMQLRRFFWLHTMPNIHHIPATLSSMEIWWLFKV